MRETDIVDGKGRTVELLVQEVLFLREQTAQQDILHILHFP